MLIDFDKRSFYIKSNKNLRDGYYLVCEIATTTLILTNTRPVRLHSKPMAARQIVADHPEVFMALFHFQNRCSSGKHRETSGKYCLRHICTVLP